MSLIVVGTMAFDAIETPFGKTDKIIGGSATYVAYCASNFVQPVQQVSIVGYDFPKEVLQDLQSKGVQTEGVEIIKDKKSFFWAGKYHMDMNSRDTLVTDLNVLADFNPVIPETFSRDGIECFRHVTTKEEEFICRRGISLLMAQGNFPLQQANFLTSQPKGESPFILRIDFQKEQLQSFHDRVKNKDWSHFSRAEALHFLSCIKQVTGGIDETGREIRIDLE